MQDSESKLARLRGQTNGASSRSSSDEGKKSVKMERRSTSPIHRNEGSSRNQHQSKPELLIPSVSLKISQPILIPGSSAKASINSSSQASPSISNPIAGSRVKANNSQRLPIQQEDMKIKEKGTKRKFGKTFISSVTFADTSICILPVHI